MTSRTNLWRRRRAVKPWPRTGGSVGRAAATFGTVALVINGFSHVQLIVRDVDVSAAWYERALGMERFTRGTFAGGEYAALRSRSGGFVIGLQSEDPERATSPATGSIEHLSFAVTDPDVLAEARERLHADGIATGELFEEAVSWNLRMRDPDGLQIELTAPKPGPGRG